MEIWIDISYGKIHHEDDGTRIEMPEIQRRVEITSCRTDVFESKGSLLLMVKKELEEIERFSKLPKNNIKVSEG